jgi:hypothetical protein
MPSPGSKTQAIVGYISPAQVRIFNLVENERAGIFPVFTEDPEPATFDCIIGDADDSKEWPHLCH